MFLDLIKKKRCRLKDYIDSYQGQPLIILGAGHVSKGIIQYLNNHAITDFHVCVNDCKWEAGNVAWGGYPVERIGDVLHKPEDIIEIPRYIKCLHKDYKFYLRRYESSFRELVLYAVP